MVLDLNIFNQKFKPFTIDGVEEIIYLNTKRLKGRFMDVEADIPDGSEFIKFPWHFDFEGTPTNELAWTECIVYNDPERYSQFDDDGNRKFAVCLLHSETFFNYFIPKLRYNNCKEFDNWEARWEYVEQLQNIFANYKTKSLFLDFILDDNYGQVLGPKDLITSDPFGNYVLNRHVLFYMSIPSLKDIIDNFGIYLKR